eukprot:Hpha_TRINITY_DN15390_c1_g10::TRINITY_DN15390_c1_g10_i1::g.92191::m.92191
MAADKKKEGAQEVGKEGNEENADDKRKRVRDQLLGTRARWSSGILQCHTDCASCVSVCCCFPCEVAKSRSEFDETAKLLNLACACCNPCFFTLVLRHDVRVGYQIKGNWVKDVFMSLLCCCCVACQLRREVTKRGKVTNGIPYVQMMEMEQGVVEAEVDEQD